MNKKILFLFILVTAVGLQAKDINLIKVALNNAFNTYPSSMLYHEEGGADPRNIEFNISGYSNQRYTIGSSSDNKSKPNKYDDRPQYKTGDTGDFRMSDFAGYIDINSNGQLRYTTKTIRENGNEFELLDYSVTIKDLIDGKTYPLSGTLYVESSSSVPYKLELKYDNLPPNTKEQNVTVYFEGRDIEHCKVDIIEIRKKGKFLLFSYTLSSNYSFRY